MVRSSFSILFAIRESKARKSGKAPIEITITVMGKDALYQLANKFLSTNGTKLSNK